MATEPIIEVHELVADFGEQRVLDGVSFEVAPGEIHVIMGESGSGKSTLLRQLLGLLRPTSGEVRLFGEPVTGAGKRELMALRGRVGVAFQRGALLSSMSLLENVELPLRHNTELDSTTIRIMARMKLELMNLGGFDDHMPAQLSGGMAKRAGLARAVAMDPELLFFDEPSAGLDPVTSAELDDLILQLRDALRMTIVVVTHELESAIKIADRITVLADGVIRMSGTVAEVRASDDAHIQNMLHRRPRSEQVDSETYLRRLTR